LLAFLYYLRSPGWLRYILIAELLILFILPHTVSLAANYTKERFKNFPMSSNWLSCFVLAILVLVQFAQMFTSAQIFSGDGDLRTAAYLRNNFPDKSIGVLNSLELAALLDSSKVYMTFFNAGLPIAGENPLLRVPPLDVIVSDPNNSFAKEGGKILDSRYLPPETVGGYSIYILK
jgi:hypothetical protein